MAISESRGLRSPRSIWKVGVQAGVAHAALVTEAGRDAVGQRRRGTWPARPAL